MLRSRPVLTVLALALTAALLGACGRPTGTDGNLLDDWGPLSPPQQIVPVVGECRSSYSLTRHDLLSVDTARTVPCTEPHQQEVVGVAALPDAVAAGGDRPTRDKLASVFPACEEAAAKYLGTDWQNGRLYLTVNPPTYAAWRGGARYYHCDISAIGPDNTGVRAATASLKTTVTAGGPDAWGCAAAAGGDDKAIFRLTPAASCTEAHNMEYVGFAVAPPTAAAPADQTASKNLFSGACKAKFLAYTGMSGAGLNRQRDLSWAWWRTSDDAGWAAGDHSVRCYLFLTDRNISRSVKGNGDAAI